MCHETVFKKKNETKWPCVCNMTALSNTLQICLVYEILQTLGIISHRIRYQTGIMLK